MKKPGKFSVAWWGWLGLALLLPHLASAAWPSDPLVNIPICTASGYQDNARAVSDGAGGAIFTWRDGRTGGTGIYAQRVSASGIVQWTTHGAAVGPAYFTPPKPGIVADGAGGAIIAWFDWRGPTGAIYAQRINASGAVVWTADGVALGAARYSMPDCAITSDESGGAIVTWQDLREGVFTTLAQRITGDGTVAWAVDGVVLCTAPGGQGLPVLTSDGANGAIFAWLDGRANTDPMMTNYDIYAARIADWGGVVWGQSDGMPVCVEAGDQISPAITSDGAMGAIITWMDARSGGNDIYAQRILDEGSNLWNWGGEPVCTAASEQANPSIVSDGAGGAIIAWHDSRGGGLDIYAQRITAGGPVQWLGDGQPVCAAAGNQHSPLIVADATGGAIIVWTDVRAGNGDIYGRRLSAGGVPQGPDGGVAISTATGDQIASAIATDGTGGAIVAWRDSRGVNYDIYAQRFTHSGALGAEPVIARVQDIPNDQGGRVKLSWYASVADASPDYGIGSYWIWRSVPPNYAAKALAGGARLIDADKATTPVVGETLTSTLEGGQIIFWEYVGSQYAAGDAGYSFVVPTTSDSLATSNPRTKVRVQARATSGGAFWNSLPDSGYSVDNLAPTQPAAFTGQYLASSTVLHWSRSAAPDLSGYQLFRGAAADFVPGPSTFVVAKADTGYVDTVSGSHFYKLCAVDLHGNLSSFAVLAPQFASGVSGQLPAAAVLSQNAPNPFNPRTAIRFELRAAGATRLSIYDVAGRIVRTLVNESLSAGTHEVIWDGLDASGRAMGSGSYLARLESGGTVQTVRMALVR